MEKEQQQVRDVTNALLGTFSIGDLVRISGVTSKDWEWINGSITVIVGINTEEKAAPYIIGVKKKDGNGFLRCDPKFLQRYTPQEYP